MSDIYNGKEKEIQKAIDKLYVVNRYAAHETYNLVAYLWSATTMKSNYTVPAFHLCFPLRIVVNEDGIHHKVYYGNLEPETIDFMQKYFPYIEMIKVKEEE